MTRQNRGTSNPLSQWPRWLALSAALFSIAVAFWSMAAAPDQQRALEQGLRSFPPVAVFMALFLFWNRFARSGPQARWLWGIAAVAILIGRDVAAYHAFDWQERIIAFDVLPPLIAFCAGYWVWSKLTVASAEARPTGHASREA